MSENDCQKRSVFGSWRKDDGNLVETTSSGRLFQIRGTAAEKDLTPTVDSLASVAITRW